MQQSVSDRVAEVRLRTTCRTTSELRLASVLQHCSDLEGKANTRHASVGTAEEDGSVLSFWWRCVTSLTVMCFSGPKNTAAEVRSSKWLPHQARLITSW